MELSENTPVGVHPDLAAAKSIFIGTSGWHYKHWRGAVYPERLPASEMLGFYCQHFDTVERNATFYRLAPARSGPRARPVFRADSRPRLRTWPYCDSVAAAVAGGRRPDAGASGKPCHGAAATPSSFEMKPGTRRRLSYFGPAQRGSLYFPFSRFQSPIELTAGFTYIRLHGPGAKYQGSYGDAALRAWAGSKIGGSRRVTAILTMIKLATLPRTPCG